jgi:tetrahydromethanopterin S-methyltransferase subunit B
MEKRFDKLESKVDQLDTRLDNIERILDRNTTSLEEHMKRSTMLEMDMGPVKAHVALVALGFRGVVWFCGVIAGIAGFIYILKDLGILRF